MIGQVLRGLALVTRPRMGHDVDSPLEVEDETPNLYEPGLTDDELVMTRQLLEERFGDQTSPAVLDSAGVGSAAVSGPPPQPPAAGQPTWVDWAVPAICEVLAQHMPIELARDEIWCADRDQPGERHTHGLFEDRQEWREHVGPEIAQHLRNAVKSSGVVIPESALTELITGWRDRADECTLRGSSTAAHHLQAAADELSDLINPQT